MKQKSTIILVGVILVFLASVGLVWFVIMQLFSQADELEVQQQAVAQLQKEEIRLVQLQRFLRQSEPLRSAILQHFITSEADSITFLNYIEQLAIEQSVGLETSSIKQIETPSGPAAVAQYTISSTKQKTIDFIALLELIPFASAVTSVSMQEAVSPAWETIVQLEILMTDSYEIKES